MQNICIPLGVVDFFFKSISVSKRISFCPPMSSNNIIDSKSIQFEIKPLFNPIIKHFIANQTSFFFIVTIFLIKPKKVVFLSRHTHLLILIYIWNPDRTRNGVEIVKLFYLPLAFSRASSSTDSLVCLTIIVSNRASSTSERRLDGYPFCEILANKKINKIDINEKSSAMIQNTIEI